MTAKAIRTAAISGGAALAIIVITQLLLPGGKGGARGTPGAILFTGLVLGLLNGLVAAGIILVYRSSRIINFSQAALGALGGTFTFLLVRLNNWPYLVAFAAGIIVSALLGMAVELLVIRRFFLAPRLAVTVLTIAIAGLLGQLSGFVPSLPIFPEDAFADPLQLQQALPLPFKSLQFQIGDLDINFGFGHVFALVLSVLTLLGLALFFRFSRAGVAVIASAENSERAELLGISVKGLSTLVWLLAGLLSGLGVILNGTVNQFSNVTGIAPSALIPALTAAVLGRMHSISLAVAAAVGISVLRQSVSWSFQGREPLIDLGLFVIVLLSLLLQRKSLERSEAGDSSTWKATEEVRPTPRELASVGGIRAWRMIFILIGAAFILLYPWFTTTGPTNFGGFIAIVGIVLASQLVLTGWAGQVSLGQFAFVGVGAVIGGAMTARWNIPFLLALPLASAFTAIVAVLIGIPALRIKGLFLAIATFAMAFAVQSSLFKEEFFGWLLPDRVDRPTLLFLDFEDERSMYYFTLVCFALVLLLVSTLRRFRTGRALIGVRENETNMQSFAVKIVRTKLAAFAISGFLCGFAGILLAHHQRAVTVASFEAERSLEIFLIGVIGGITSISGVILGTAYYAVRQNVTGDLAFLAGPMATVAILYVYPTGLSGIMYALRDAIYRIIAQRRQIVVPSLMADYDPAAVDKRLIPMITSPDDSRLAELLSDEKYEPVSDMYLDRGKVLAALKPSRLKSEEASALGAASDSLGVEETVEA